MNPSLFLHQLLLSSLDFLVNLLEVDISMLGVGVLEFPLLLKNHVDVIHLTSGSLFGNSSVEDVILGLLLDNFAELQEHVEALEPLVAFLFRLAAEHIRALLAAEAERVGELLWTRRVLVYAVHKNLLYILCGERLREDGSLL